MQYIRFKKIQTTVYRKEADRQTLLHSKSETFLSLKQCIPYSQVLRLQQICSTVKKFVQRGYKATDIKEIFDKSVISTEHI